jgi:hypothetical protein
MRRCGLAIVWRAAPFYILERKLRRELKLPRIEHCPRRTEQWIRGRRAAVGGCITTDLAFLNCDRRGVLVIVRYGAVELGGAAAEVDCPAAVD